MADSTVAALTAAAALDGTELFYGVQLGADRKVTAAQISASTLAIGGTITSAATDSVLFAGTTTTPASVRQVATRCYAYSYAVAGASQRNVQTYHHARDNITSIKVGWAGFYSTDIANTGTNTIKAAVWYNGIAYQLLFSASSSGTIPNGGVLISDALSVSIPAGAKFYVRSYQTFSVALLTRQFSTFSRDVTGGDAINSTAADQTMTGTVTDAGGSIGGQWPLVILGSSSLPAVLLIGDSRLACEGGGDSYADGVGYLGYTERSIAPYFAESNIGLGGDTALGFGARTLSNTIFQYFTHVVCEYGINDIGAGATAATIITRLQACYALFTNGQKFYQTTLEPLSTSTDAWATLANQTTAASNAERVSLNTSIRAGLSNVSNYFDICSVLESSLNSGKWGVTGGAYTGDGIHANISANTNTANALVITQGAITGTTVFLNQDSNFTYSPGSRNLTVGSVRLTNPGLAGAGSALFLDAAGNIDIDVGSYSWNEVTNILNAANVSVPAGGYYYYLMNGGTALYPALYGVYHATALNWFVGNSGNLTMTGFGNLGVGDRNLLAVTTGQENVALGYLSLVSLTSGAQNLAIGAASLTNLTDGGANVAVGYHTLYASTRDVNNIAIGSYALAALNTGAATNTQDTAIGQSCFINMTTGAGNVGVGVSVGYTMTTGSNNTLIGAAAGYALGTSASQNTMVGYLAGLSVTSGNNNTLLGTWFGPAGAMSNVIGISDGNFTLKLDYNYSASGVWTFPSNGINMLANAVSVKALYPVYAALGDNWFIGEAGNTTTTGARNMGMGLNALLQLSTGFDNVGIGQGAGQLLDVGDGNVAIGSKALQHATADTRHTAVGFDALLTMVGGGSCTAIGNRTLLNLTGAGGICVTAIGEEAGQGFTTGAYNTVIGCQAAFAMASGDSNTIVGPAFCGANITSGNYNTLIGGWFGPAGAMSSVIALSDGAGNLKLDYAYTNAATWTSPAAICVTPVAVASLPTAGIQGRRHFVTNATATTFASIVAGGGGNPVPVYDDGTNWRIG